MGLDSLSVAMLRFSFDQWMLDLLLLWRGSGHQSTYWKLTDWMSGLTRHACTFFHKALDISSDAISLKGHIEQIILDM